jgi:hypothetical protein
MDITQTTSPLQARPTANLPEPLRRSTRWTTAGAALAAAGGLGALIAGLTGHGTTSSEAYPSLSLTMGMPVAQVSLLLAAAAALVCAGLLALGAIARAVGRGRAAAGSSRARTALAIAVPVIAIAALVSTCDANPLALAGYLPAVLIGSLFSSHWREVLVSLPTAELGSQLAVAGVAVVAIIATLRALDALRGGASLPRWQQPAAAARWGRTAVAVAVAVPLLYAATRIMWVLGFPLGFDVEAYEETGGEINNGLVLAAGALVGSILTIGLVRPWGERFWAWFPGLGGKRVPVGLAVVPASIVAALILPAGVSMIVASVGQLGIASIGDLVDNWAAIGVTFLWPIWSIALAVATWAYALRRRGELALAA